jgi:hypothetical protein
MRNTIEFICKNDVNNHYIDDEKVLILSCEVSCETKWEKWVLEKCECEI